MPKCLAISWLYVRVWARALTSNPWVLASVIATVVFTTGMLYLEAGPAVVKAGPPGLLFVVRITLLGSFMTFALVDPTAFRTRRLRGFPRWVPATELEYVVGVSLPAVVLIAAVTACFSVVVLSRHLNGLLDHLMALVAMFTNAITVSYAGLVCGIAAASLSEFLSRRVAFLQACGRIVILLSMAVIIGVSFFVPTVGWDRWFRVDIAIATLFTDGLLSGVVQVATGTLLLALSTVAVWTVVGARSVRQWERPEPKEAKATQVSLTFPRNQILAISVVEVLRIARDRPLVRYISTLLLFFLGLTGLVGRQVLSLQHGPAFLVMIVYMVVFLVATVPLRSIGRDLPLKWLWMSLPVPRSAYILGKYVTATILPSVVLLVFLALAVLAGGLEIDWGLVGWSEVLTFGIVAYGLAFFWGSLQPYQQGDLSSEVSQIGGFAMSSLLAFRVLSMLQPVIGRSQWAPAIGLLALLYGVSLAVEEKRDGANQK